MRHIFERALWFVAVSGISLAFPVWAQQDSTRSMSPSLDVQVHYANGSAASQGIMVAVEQEAGGFVAQASTDSMGKASFNSLRSDVYTVIAKQPGYREATQRVDLRTAVHAYAVMELRPVAKDSQGSAVPPEGPGAAIRAKVAPAAVKEYDKGEKLLLKDRRVEESIPHLRKAIKIDGSFTQAYILLGMAYLNTGKADDAMAPLQKAVQLDPNSAAAHETLGAAWNQKKNFAAAQAELTRALQLNPDASEAQYELAKSYLESGHWQQAEAPAMKAAPSIPAAHVILGNVMLHKGDKQQAIDQYKQYIQLEPDGPMAEGARQAVQKLASKK